MIRILFILFILISSPLQSQGLLDVGVGILNHSYVENTNAYTFYIGGKFDDWGMELHVDSRFAENYLTQISNGEKSVQLDFRYVAYSTLGPLDMGIYASINSTSNTYDGYMVGYFIRLTARVWRIGAFIRYTYPIIGEHYNPATKHVNLLRFNKFLSTNVEPLRYSEERISLGINVLIGRKD